MASLLIDFPHGLGDCVQFSVVLAHLRKYRPDWSVDVKVGRGKHTALAGLCREAFWNGEPAGRHYDSRVGLGWYENYNRYTDRPNSKVTNCLHEVFGIEYDSSLGRYEIRVPAEANSRAAHYLRSVGCTSEGAKFNAVIIHYEGNTSPYKKNLAFWQAQAVCELALRLGRVPIVLDWDRRSPLPDGKRVFCPGCSPDDVWGGFGSGDAAVLAALISKAEAFIGIDSGPGKVASATDTPALICWRGHHPVQFHDPAANTTHLVPANHRALSPCGDDPRVGDYFESHYNFVTYDGEHGLAAQAQRWLAAALGYQGDAEALLGVSFVCPNGIGDVMWALTKIKSVAAGRPIDVVLSGNPCNEIDHRCEPFLKRFPFVRSVRVADVPVLEDKDDPTDVRGRYRYVSDGVRGNFHFLCPNRVLESGRRLEEWLPEYPVDYDVIDEFDWSNTSLGAEAGEALRPFAAFYLGPETGNVDEGHNRGFLWEPKHWVELGLGLKARGVNVAVVGAPYDRSYWERYVREGVGQAGMSWVDLIGRFEIGECLALLRKARVLVSYQCGLAIVTHYLGGNVVSWWRPEGDSCHATRTVSFAEAMKDAWVRPDYVTRYLGCVYRRETPADILARIDRRGWLGG